MTCIVEKENVDGRDVKLSIPGRAAGCADLTLFWKLVHNDVTLCTRDRDCEWTPHVQKWHRHPLCHRPGACCGVRTQSSIWVVAKPATAGAFLVQMIILKTNKKKRVGPRICWCVRVSASSGGRLAVRDGANFCTARVQGLPSGLSSVYWMWSHFLCQS